MKRKELIEELGYKSGLTSIQREEKCKALIGIEIEIIDEISDISEIFISLYNRGGGQEDPYDSYYDSDYLYYHIYYNKEKFEKQLATYSVGDKVNIKAKINVLTSKGTFHTKCDLELLSIVKINSKNEREKIEKEEDEHKKGSGCFVATACYGNFDAPEVIVLRHYRDSKLLKTFFGKVFVQSYYSISPFFATLILKSELLKKIIRKYFLVPIVTKLRRKGY